MSKKPKTPEIPKSKTAVYLAHRNLKQAVRKPSSPRYASTGAIGVTIPAKWESFDAFIAAVGYPPDEQHTVPMRVNPKVLAFSVKNFRWGTADESRRARLTTKRYKHKGAMWSVSELAEHYGINLSTLRTRLRNGWTLDDAITKD